MSTNEMFAIDSLHRQKSLPVNTNEFVDESFGDPSYKLSGVVDDCLLPSFLGSSLKETRRRFKKTESVGQKTLDFRFFNSRHGLIGSELLDAMDDYSNAINSRDHFGFENANNENILALRDQSEISFVVPGILNFPKKQDAVGAKKGSGLENTPGPQDRQQDGGKKAGGGAEPNKETGQGAPNEKPPSDKELGKTVKRLMKDCKVKFFYTDGNGSTSNQLTLDVTDDALYHCDTDFFVDVTNVGKCSILFYITVGNNADGTLHRPIGEYTCGSLKNGENSRVHFRNVSTTVREKTHLSCLYVKAATENMSQANVQQYFETGELMQLRAQLVTKSETIYIKYRKSKVKKLVYT